MMNLTERIEKVEEISRQLQMAYPQYSNKNIESFNLNCIKSIGDFAFIAIFANVDCYTITLYNSIGFEKIEIEKNDIDFQYLYKIIEIFMERKTNL